MDLSLKAKALEEMGKTGNLDQAGETLTEIESEYVKVKFSLEMIQKNG
jgi:hypothetical protein